MDIFAQKNNEKIIPLQSDSLEDIKDYLANPNTTINNLPMLFHTKELDVGRLEYAVNKIVERHEMLRSHFKCIDGNYYKAVRQEYQIKIEVVNELNFKELIKPFNLLTGPLFRISVFNNYIFLDFSHLIADGIAIGLFFNELNTFYSGKEIKGLPIPSVEDITPSADDIKENNKFWNSFFEAPFKRVHLPYEGKKTYRIGPCNTIYYPLGIERMKKIKAFALQQNITPYIFTISAYLLLISQRCDTQDICIHTNMSNRNLKNIKVIALLTLPIIMRYTWSNIERIDDFYTFVKDLNAAFLAHQNADFIDVLEPYNLKKADTTGFSFVYQREMISNIKFDDELCDPIPIPQKEVFNDVILSFFASKHFPGIQLEYRDDLYSRNTIDSFLDDYIKIIDLLMEDKMETIGEVLQVINQKKEFFYKKDGRTADKFKSVFELWSTEQ